MTQPTYISVVPVQNTFIHYKDLSKTCRSHSAPARPARCDVDAYDHQEICRTAPSRTVKQTLQQLSLEELCWILDVYGVEYLQCEEHRRAVRAVAPRSLVARTDLAPLVNDGTGQHARRYLSSLSFRELVVILRNLANKKLSTPGYANTHGVHHFVSICNALVGAQFRSWGASPLVLAVPLMQHVCDELGFSSLWHETRSRNEIQKHLKVVVTFVRAGTGVPLVGALAELEQIRAVIPDASVTEWPQSCEDSTTVWHVMGHTRAISFADVDKVPISNLSLVIFNGCNSLALGRHMRARGVKNVICWNGAVPDQVAEEFGIAFWDTCRSECDIRAIYAKACSSFPPEHRPVLLDEKMTSMDADETCFKPPLEVFLNVKDPTSCNTLSREFDGSQATVHEHTAHNNMVMVTPAGSSSPVIWRFGHWDLLHAPAKKEPLGRLDKNIRRYSIKDKLAVEPWLASLMEAINFNTNVSGGAAKFRREIAAIKAQMPQKKRKQLDDAIQGFTSKTYGNHARAIAPLIEKWRHPKRRRL
eukprot:TRINITY_DN31917_c0_g1_i1.p1 TRINITY_DN31917_c0_g1~~TRINITY_DN31917_c0_g1_i1.p1  ORF type:complete len:543 (+),score=104.39 TRINITY_DN31917_c0_g1_i1:37-1629(+)